MYTQKSSKCKAVLQIEFEPLEIGDGSYGTAVGIAQFLLFMLGYECELDNEFGPDTMRAVAEYQAEHNLSVDGIIGSETWKKLLGDA